MGSVSRTLDLVRDRLPSFLDARALERAMFIASRIPDGATSHNLEFRLNSTTAIDFLTFCGSKHVVEQYAQLIGPNPTGAWKHNLSVLENWTSAEGELASVPFFSFEYDGGDTFVEAEPEASISAAIDDQHHARHWQPLRGETAETRERGAKAYRYLLPESALVTTMPIIERIYEALPPLGAVLHAPILSARNPVVAKPYVVLPRDGLVRFLEDIEWPGSMGALEQLMSTFYSAFPKSVYIDLTVSDRVHARLGLVTSQFQQQEADFSTLDWWGLPPELEHFKDELGEWQGFSEEWLDGRRVWLRRWLDTKAVLHDEFVEYKAYLGFSPTRPPLFG